MQEKMDDKKNGSEIIKEDPEAQSYLEHLLNDGCNEGDSGAEMELPPWYNEELFQKGQSYMNKYRFVITCGMLSGLIAVLAIPSILHVLICTRQSSSPLTAYRRYVRTILHTKAFYKYSAKSKNSKFWESLRGVRHAHSRSSRACHKLGAGQITQKDLALTQFGFFGFLSLDLHRIKVVDDEFLEATSHLWRVLGYLLGIKDEYNICGESWAKTKARLEIVRRKVFTPALENTGEDFERMTKALIDGLWAVNTTLTFKSYLFFTKRLAYVKGYEYYEFDYLPGTKGPNDSLKKSRYYELGWWDRFVVSQGLLIITYLHQYDIIRWYFNFRIWFGEFLMYYFPYIAIFKYGIKNAYVRIFTNNGSRNDFEFHLKED